MWSDVKSLYFHITQKKIKILKVFNIFKFGKTKHFTLQQYSLTFVYNYKMYPNPERHLKSLKWSIFTVGIRVILSMWLLLFFKQQSN